MICYFIKDYENDLQISKLVDMWILFGDNQK